MSIYFFETPSYLFSNWSAHQVEYKGILYPTAEHAYHAQKFTDEQLVQQILTAKAPFLAKQLAHQNTRQQVANWGAIKLQVMEDIIADKISQHADVKSTLLQTGNEEIIEDSPEDYFWGCGKDKTGRNELGKIWMKLRETLI